MYEPTHFLWSTNDTTALNNNLPAGNYTVSVSDARGCGDTLNFEIHEPSEVILTYSTENVSCFGGSNGAINMQATGGNENYSFWINGAQSSSSAVGLLAGTYAVSVSDSAQCYSTSSNLVITQPNAVSSIMNSTPEIDGFDGTSSVSIQGGVAPYSIIWNDPNNQYDSLAVYLNEGWYTATITDANGCLHSDSVYVGTLGLNDQTGTTFSVFPNPAKDIITINGITGKEIKVFDANGKLIKKLPFNHSLSTAELTSGIYYLEIDLEKTVARLKFYKIN
jgi:hypothetical protein